MQEESSRETGEGKELWIREGADRQREHMRETEQKTAENTENTLYVY